MRSSNTGLAASAGAPGTRVVVAGEVVLPGEQLAQHHQPRLGNARLEAPAGAAAARAARDVGLLVGPVRRDAVLGMLVHLRRADLDLDRPAVVALHHGVQRAVAVGLRPGDVVVELAGDRRPALVHPREHRVAAGDVGHDDAQRQHVHDAVEGDALPLHLLPDAVEVLRPALHLRREAVRGEVGLELGAQADDPRLAVGAPLVELAGDRVVALGVEEAEGEVLELPLDLPDAEPVGERREHLHRLGRELLRARRLARREPAQRLQPRGQAQQHHAQVAREREQHLPHPLGLQRLVGGIDARALGGALQVAELPAHGRPASPATRRRAASAPRRACRAASAAWTRKTAARSSGAAPISASTAGRALGVGERVLARRQRAAGKQRRGELARRGDRVGIGTPRCARGRAGSARHTGLVRRV